MTSLLGSPFKESTKEKRTLYQGSTVREFFLFITQTTISRWCPARLFPLRSLLRSLQVSRFEFHFMAGITMTPFIIFENAKNYNRFFID
ncbi:hypothetical protein CFP56_021291 [Quercus suber]|uniref:Uncharacterized protein n=1 Tax=Quercus suber TaxID=58331 RepID=A0AAW0KG21_QUESU